jgi:hypothetical protein
LHKLPGNAHQTNPEGVMVTRLDTITRDESKRKLEGCKPNNEDRSKGFALVNVLAPKDFEREHIPGSIDIPVRSEGGFEQRFDKNKEIIVCCAPPSRDASDRSAKRLDGPRLPTRANT